MSDLLALGRVLAQTRRRIRAQHALRAAAIGCVTSLSAAAVVHGASRVLALRIPGQTLLLGCLGLPLLGALIALLWPVKSAGIARRIDHAHGTHDTVRTAVEYAGLAATERTPFMDAHLRDAESKASSYSAQRAAPLAVPRATRWLLLPMLGWVLASLAAPRAQPEGAPPARPHPAKLLAADDLDAFRQELKELTERAPLAPLPEAEARAYNNLLERLLVGDLSRAEALNALLTMERKLLDESADTSAEDQAQLRQLADDLARTHAAAAQALRAGEVNEASRALRDAAKQLPTQSDAERAKLAEALAHARERERVRTANSARERELESLLRPRTSEQPTPPGERSLLDRRRRELEHLRRDQAQEGRRNRELSRLSRDLAGGAEALERGDDPEAQKALENAARDLERFAEQQLGGQQQRELAKQISQLRELMQRSQPKNAGGSPDAPGTEREQREQQFVLRAQGQGAPPSQGQQQGQEQGGDQGLNQARQGGGAGSEGGNGQESGGQQGPGRTERVLVPGQSGSETVNLLIPRSTSVRVNTGGAGDEHDPRKLSAASQLEATHQDSQLQGAQGRGLTRSQVILDAADRGFATASYHKVYSDYRAHAEDVIERDEVPPGYRFYVRRYFQLIRPRDE